MFSILKKVIFSPFVLGGLSLFFSLEASSSPSGWIREQGQDDALFHFYENIESNPEEDRVTKSNRFVELANSQDSFRENLVMNSAKTQLYRYEVEQLQIDEKGSVEFDYENSKVNFKYYKNKQWRERSEKLEAPHFVGAMIPQFILNNHEQLAKGERIRFKLAVPYMVKSFDFYLQKEEDLEFEGRQMISIRMSPSHVLVSAVVRPLFFILDPEEKKIRKILGRHFLKKRTSSGWDAFQGETLFIKPSIND
jgi:hypothetical protein